MLNTLYSRRFTIFLFSFLVLIFGDLLIPVEDEDLVQTILLLQNMLFSMLLFIREPQKMRITMYGVFLVTIITQLLPLLGYSGSLIFALVFLIYFVLISYQIFKDLLKQKVIGLEMVSAAFCGYILLGVVSSIIFLTIDKSAIAFNSPVENRQFSDYLYFSFITLLTIGYGDMTPISELSQKAVVMVSLVGHFYTVFVMAVIITKFLQAKDDYSNH